MDFIFKKLPLSFELRECKVKTARPIVGALHDSPQPKVIGNRLLVVDACCISCRAGVVFRRDGDPPFKGSRPWRDFRAKDTAGILREGRRR